MVNGPIINIIQVNIPALLAHHLDVGPLRGPDLRKQQNPHKIHLKSTHLQICGPQLALGLRVDAARDETSEEVAEVGRGLVVSRGLFGGFGGEGAAAATAGPQFRTRPHDTLIHQAHRASNTKITVELINEDILWVEPQRITYSVPQRHARINISLLLVPRAPLVLPAVEARLYVEARPQLGWPLRFFV